MQNDTSVLHIAVTCPHCGKHYRKVPYAAIKKFNFAFCKQCNAKFHISAAALEEALQLSLHDAQRDTQAAQPAGGHDATAFTGAEQPGSSSHDAPQGPAHESAQAAPDARQAPTPEEPAGQGDTLPDTAGEPKVPVAASVGLDQALEQKITDLAATMEATFSQPPPSGDGDLPGAGTENMLDAAAGREPPFSINFAKADDEAALAAGETDSLQIEGLPDFTPPAETGFETSDEFQAVPPQPSSASEDFFDQTFIDELNALPTEEQPAAEPALDDLCLDELGSAYPEEQPAPDTWQPATRYPADSAGEDPCAEEAFPGSMHGENLPLPAPEEQPGEDALPDAAFSPELIFSAPGEENLPEELQDDIFIEPLTPAAPEEDIPEEAVEPAALFEELPPPYSEDGLPDENAEGRAFSEDLAAAAPEIPSLFKKELPAEDSISEDILLQDIWQESPQQEDIDEALPGHFATAAENEAGDAAGGLSQESGDDGLGAAPAQESFEEELLDESLIEDLPEPGAEEEPFIDEFLEESSVEERYGQKTAGLAGGAFSAPPDVSFFDSLQDADGNRDVSAMLKQLVLPSDEIEEGMEQFVLFTLGEQTFAAPIANVFELSLPPEMIAVPNTPPWILGVSNMRGEIISVIDFKGFLNIEPDSLKKPGRMLIAQTIDKQMIIGLMVDSINGIKYFSVDAIQPLEQQEPGLSDAFFLGACLYESEVVIFLDFEQILQSSKMRQFQ